MAETLKTTQVAKDFNLKPKDVSDIFAEMHIDKKTGASVSSDEFALFLNRITIKNQIKDLEAYIGGKNKLTVDRPEAEKKPAPAPAPAAAPAPAPAPAPQKPEKAPEAKPQQKPAPAADPRAQQRRPEQQRPAQPQRQDGSRPQDNRPQRQDGFRGERRDNRNNYRMEPQGNIFANKLKDMNRAAEGFRKNPQGQPDRKPMQPNAQARPAQQPPVQQRPAQQPTPAPVQKPVEAPAKAPATPLPSQAALLEKQSIITVASSLRIKNSI